MVPHRSHTSKSGLKVRQGEERTKRNFDSPARGVLADDTNNAFQILGHQRRRTLRNRVQMHILQPPVCFWRLGCPESWIKGQSGSSHFVHANHVKSQEWGHGTENAYRSRWAHLRRWKASFNLACRTYHPLPQYFVPIDERIAHLLKVLPRDALRSRGTFKGGSSELHRHSEKERLQFLDSERKYGWKCWNGEGFRIFETRTFTPRSNVFQSAFFKVPAGPYRQF